MKKLLVLPLSLLMLAGSLSAVPEKEKRSLKPYVIGGVVVATVGAAIVGTLLYRKITRTAEMDALRPQLLIFY